MLRAWARWECAKSLRERKSMIAGLNKPGVDGDDDEDSEADSLGSDCSSEGEGKSANDVIFESRWKRG